MAKLNFLQLVQTAWAETGLGNTGPAGVDNQTGRHRDMVRWVQTAHEEIQNLREWTWDWARQSFPLTVNQDAYDPGEGGFGITGGIRRFLRDGAYLTRENDPQPYWLSYLEWEQFRLLPTVHAKGIPTVFTVRPDGWIVYYPIPNEPISAVHEFYRQPLVLAGPAEYPRMPERFHMAIVWKAVMLYASFNKDWSLHQTAKDSYDDLMDEVFTQALPETRTAGPLA